MPLDRSPWRRIRKKGDPTEVSLPKPGPLISVVMPVFNTPEDFLVKAIDSVKRQGYANWQLCICDDASTSKRVPRVLSRASEADSRIDVVRSVTRGGISSAGNRALGLAKGEWVAFLDHDDELTPDALSECVSFLDENPDVDAVYTDEDKLEPDGRHTEPFFKPDWSPAYFKGVMYVGHLLVVRRSLAESVGGFDARFDGVQDFEFVLRLGERTHRIEHLPKTLYHWRKAPGSVAADIDAKADVPLRQVEAVNDHLTRCRVRAVARAHHRFAHRVALEPEQPREWPLVTVIVLAREGEGRSERLLESVRRSTYPTFELVTMTERSREAAASWNASAERARGEYLVFVCAGVEISTPAWLEALVWPLETDGVGITAPLVLDPKLRVRSAGIAFGRGADALDVMVGFASGSDGYAGSLSCMREVSAVRSTCLATSKRLLREVGLFRADYATRLHAADYCLRVRETGRRVLVTPRATIVEHGPRNEAVEPLDWALFTDAWKPLLDRGDPYYSPRFGGRAADYVTAHPTSA